VKRSPAAVQTVLDTRAAGATLRPAAAAAGVHIATVCRWQARDPALRDALVAAERQGLWVRHPFYRRPRRVPWHPLCPECGGRAVVRAARRPFARFWGCEWWPLCRWATWRPRFPRDCPACGGPRYWSHSRLSIGCPGCGRRWPTEVRIITP
jgi:hypothetical protein